MDAEAASRRGRPPGHDLRPQRQELPVRHDLSSCEYRAPPRPLNLALSVSHLAATLSDSLASAADLFMSPCESGRLATNQTSFCFQWILSHLSLAQRAHIFAANVRRPSMGFGAASSEAICSATVPLIAGCGRATAGSLFHAPQTQMIVGCLNGIHHQDVATRGNIRYSWGVMYKQMTNKKYNRPRNGVPLGGEMPLTKLSAALKLCSIDLAVV